MESVKCLLRRKMRHFYLVNIFREKFVQPVSKKFKSDNKIIGSSWIISDTIDGFRDM